MYPVKSTEFIMEQMRSKNQDSFYEGDFVKTGKYVCCTCGHVNKIEEEIIMGKCENYKNFPHNDNPHKFKKLNRGGKNELSRN